MKLWTAIGIASPLLAFLAARFPEFILVTLAVIGAVVLALAVYLAIRFIAWAARQPGGRG